MKSDWLCTHCDKLRKATIKQINNKNLIDKKNPQNPPKNPKQNTTTNKEKQNCENKMDPDKNHVHVVVSGNKLVF